MRKNIYMKKAKSIILLTLFLFLVFIKGFSQSLEHPIICITDAERTELLTKINNNSWARSIVTQLRNDVDTKMVTHQTNPSAVFAGLSDLAENDAPLNLLLQQRMLNIPKCCKGLRIQECFI